jgi:hypothetical protein
LRWARIASRASAGLPLHGRQNSLVMKLAALRSSVYIENTAALLAQQTNDRIQQ